MNIVKYFTNCIAVFQGGGCKAIAYIGAYEKAYEEGMFFSELAGTSAGAVIAALIAAGGSPKDLRKVVNDVNFSQFKKPCGKSCWPVRLAEAALAWNEKRKHQHPQKDNFWQTIKECKPYSWKALNKNLGFFDSEVIEVKMREWLKELTGKDNVTFADLAPNLHIVATDVVNKSVMEWNKNDTPDMPVAKAVRASCSIPVYFTPTERIWVDGGLMSNCPDFIFGDDPNYYQMLTLRVKSEQEDVNGFDGFVNYGKQLVNTIVEGADNLQHTFVSSPNNIEIMTTGISATDFDLITPQVIDELIGDGYRSMKDFLDRKEAEFEQKQQQGIDDFWPRVILKHREQMYSMLSYWGYVAYEEVFVSCVDTSWSWSIFPTLLGWINKGAKIVVYVSSKTPTDKRESSRQRMLQAMGCLLVEEQNLPFLGYFFVNKNGGRAVVYQEKPSFDAKVYNDVLDGIVIRGWIDQLKSKTRLENYQKVDIKLVAVGADEIINLLKKDRIYRNADMHFERVELSKLLFLNSTIRSLKYKHIYHMFDVYRRYGLEPFSPAALVFKDQKRSYIGPPVVEVHDGKYYVIEGNTRCLYAFKHGVSEMEVLVVENVKTKLPVGDEKNSYAIDKVIITEREIKAKERYQGFDYSLFRHIEECIRPYDSYML